MERLPTSLDELIGLVDRRDGKPLQLLTDAVILSGRLGELADDLVDHFVQRARQEGASWADIGQSIGVSKQAAQKRFVPGRRPGLRGARRGLFTRFDSSARFAVKTAVHHAYELGSEEIGTLHLVIGLADERSGPASKAIDALAEESTAVAEAAMAALGRGTGASPDEHIRFGDRSKKVLELSLREAIRSESRHIGSEHILLGLLRDEKSDGAKLLNRHGVTYGDVETWLTEKPVTDH